MPAPTWRFRWESFGPTVGNEILKAYRLMGDGQLEHAEEQHPSATGPASVESKRELVQVAGKVSLVGRAWVRSPAIQSVTTRWAPRQR